MRLEGSCHCGAVRFSVHSTTPQPYMWCYCSICRKTGGGGGYAINLGAEAGTLEVSGEDKIAVYQALLKDGEQSPARRHFCSLCGSALWVFDPRWPELLHPFASAVDSPLPEPPERVHIMLDYKANWVARPKGSYDRSFSEYPEESIADWHAHRGLTLE